MTKSLFRFSRNRVRIYFIFIFVFILSLLTFNRASGKVIGFKIKKEENKSSIDIDSSMDSSDATDKPDESISSSSDSVSSSKKMKSSPNQCLKQFVNFMNANYCFIILCFFVLSIIIGMPEGIWNFYITTWSSWNYSFP